MSILRCNERRLSSFNTRLRCQVDPELDGPSRSLGVATVEHCALSTNDGPWRQKRKAHAVSDTSQGDGWWIASDDKWYPPELHPDAIVAREAAEAAQATQPSQHVGSTGPATVQAAGHQPPWSPATAAQTSPGTPPTPEPETNRRGLMLGLAATVLIVGLGLLAWRLLAGAGSGGAASPEAAVEQLLDSITEGDAVGLIDVIDPDEIEAWFGSFGPALELGRQRETDATAEELDAFTDRLIEAFDLEVTAPNGEELTFEVASLDPDHRIQRVRFDGISAVLNTETTNGETLIVGPPEEAIGIDLDRIDGAGLEAANTARGLDLKVWVPGEKIAQESLSDVHLDLVTVEKDGSWYISIGYSIIESIRNSTGADPLEPSYGRAFRLVDGKAGGADSPEQAVHELVEAIEDLDYSKMIELTDPLGLPYLHDYQGQFERNLADAPDFDLRVSTLELTTSEWNGRTLVEIRDIAGSVSDGSFRFDPDTWCGQATSPDGERVEACAQDGLDQLSSELDVEGEITLPDSLAVVVIERNGRWYLDPLGTVGRLTEQVAESVEDLGIDDAFESSSQVTGFNGLIAHYGPILTPGDQVTSGSTAGYAAVAADIDSLIHTNVAGPISPFGPPKIGLARIESSAGAVLPGIGNERAKPVEWATVYKFDDAPTFPAIALGTDSPITVSLEDIEVIEVGPDGYSGAISNDGRPVIATFAGAGGQGWEFAGVGARYTAVSSWQSSGVVWDSEFWASDFGDPSWGAFTVISGEPGAEFTIELSSVDDDVTEPFDDPSGENVADITFDDDRVQRFVEVAASSGFTELVVEQQGGYFDGCIEGDPTATTYGFEDSFLDLVLVTTYESPEAAQVAFRSLTLMESPCDGYPGLQIQDVVEHDTQSLTVTITYDGDETTYYEYYSVRDDTIVTATGASDSAIDYAVIAVESYGG